MAYTIRREFLPLVVIVATIALAVYFYPLLPEKVAMHYDIHGQADRFSPKSQLVILWPALLVGIYLLLTFIPLLDPFWRKFKPRYDILLALRDVVLMFFLYLFVLMLIGAQRQRLSLEAMGVGFGMLFVLLGNYLPRVPRNFFFGLRSPWTLASETVWRKTHTVGGWLFVIFGLIAVIMSVCGINLGLTLVLTLTPPAVIGGFVYPLLLYRKLSREGRLASPEI